MKKILKWFSLLFAVSVTVFVIYFLYDINSDISVQKPQPLEFKTTITKQEAEAFWLKHLSQQEKRGYYFPVDEVYIETKLVAKKKKPPVYQLIVDDLDPYQVFCLKQELSQHKVPFLFQKKGKKLVLLVYNKDIQKLKSLVKVLKKYQIEAKISKKVTE